MVRMTWCARLAQGIESTLLGDLRWSAAALCECDSLHGQRAALSPKLAAMDRLFSSALFGLALICFSLAFLLLLNDFVVYLQTGRWQTLSLLQFGYDSSLLRARWFLSHRWGLQLHDVLAQIPVPAVLLCVSPLAWWASGRFERR
ncbi:MAG: hypothetical protein KDI31_15915 [Pseudomonadales bacterium]|nr:hypothetical protein [Pseudomonadales bacterium]